MINDELNSFKKEVFRNFRSSAISYYKMGIDIFHNSRTKSWINFQPAIGNLSISIELLLKSVVIEKAIDMLYSNLPDEAKLLLCHPDSLTEEHNYKAFLNDMKSFTHKVIMLDKAISLFYIFYPELKREYRHFFSSLSFIRNISVHAAIPDFQKYELDRIAFYSTKLFNLVLNIDELVYPGFKIPLKTKNFMDDYKEERIKKVKLALDNAKDKVRNRKLGEIVTLYEDWENMKIICPICGNDAICKGETEEEVIDEETMYLNFQCDKYLCNVCGLKMDDFEELSLAGMETEIERNDFGKWIFEHYYDDDRC